MVIYKVSSFFEKKNNTKTTLSFNVLPLDYTICYRFHINIIDAYFRDTRDTQI